MGSKEGITRWVGRGQLEPGSPGSAGAGVGGGGSTQFYKEEASSFQLFWERPEAASESSHHPLFSTFLYCLDVFQNEHGLL